MLIQTRMQVSWLQRRLLFLWKYTPLTGWSFGEWDVLWYPCVIASIYFLISYRKWFVGIIFCHLRVWTMCNLMVIWLMRWWQSSIKFNFQFALDDSFHYVMLFYFYIVGRQKRQSNWNWSSESNAGTIFCSSFILLSCSCMVLLIYAHSRYISLLNL